MECPDPWLLFAFMCIVGMLGMATGILLSSFIWGRRNG